MRPAAEKQATPSYCAVASLRAALRWLGVHTEQPGLARVVGTTDEGTDEDDLMQALDSLGCEWMPICEGETTKARSSLVAWAPLVPLIAYLPEPEHWVVVLGMCGARLNVFDPETGLIEPTMPHEFMGDWAGELGEPDRYYALAVIGC